MLLVDVVVVDLDTTSSTFFESSTTLAGLAARQASNTQPILQHSVQSVKNVVIHDGVFPSTTSHIPLLGSEKYRTVAVVLLVWTDDEVVVTSEDRHAPDSCPA